MSKTAIIIYSDPKSQTDEALGRVFNALALAYELQEKQLEVVIAFSGTGTRWPTELVKPEHPAHAVYQAVKGSVAGICGGCADVFGAADDARKTGLKLDYERAVPGTPGLLDQSHYIEAGYAVINF